MASSSNEVGKKLLELLGIPPEYCLRATITMEAGANITIEAEYCAIINNEPASQEMKNVIKNYEITEVVKMPPEPTPPENVEFNEYEIPNK